MMRNAVNINWRYLIVYAASLVMEGSWIYAFLLMLNSSTVDNRLWVPALVLVFPVSWAFHKLLQNLRWHKVPVFIVSWLVWLIVLLLLVKIQLFPDSEWGGSDWLLAVPRAIVQIIYTFSPELLLLISSAVIWWLGKRMADRGVKFTGVVTGFQFGLIMLLMTFFFAYMLDVSIAHSVIIVIVFFLCALLGISLAHAKENTGWFSTGMNRGQWTGLLLVAIALVLLLGLFIGLVVSADLLHMIVAAIKWIGAWITKIVLFLVSLIPFSDHGELVPPEAMQPQMGASEQYELWKMPENIRAILRIIWAVVFGGIIVIALWQISSQIFKWMRRRLSSMSGDEIEPLRGAFKADIIGLFRFIAGKLRSIFRSVFKRRKADVLPENISVRQIYRHFLRWARSRGYPRHMAQTPYDFLAVMNDIVPERRTELHLITEYYVNARYGRSVPTGADVSQLADDWKKIKKSRVKRPKEEQTDVQGENENG
jgi:hypothetical protein